MCVVWVHVCAGQRITLGISSLPRWALEYWTQGGRLACMHARAIFLGTFAVLLIHI